MFTQTMQTAENCLKLEVNFNDPYCNHGFGPSPQPRSTK